MKVKRIVADFQTPDPAAAKRFYQDLLGLDLLMDLGWIATFGSSAKMTVQVSFASEGGSGAPTPDLSIEVDDLDEALRRMKKAKIAIEYGPAKEPWGVRGLFEALVEPDAALRRLAGLPGVAESARILEAMTAQLWSAPLAA
jgi:catechol 2,3-dioxygenase-like lactoylglutathione lyase family enzyme